METQAHNARDDGSGILVILPSDFGCLFWYSGLCFCSFCPFFGWHCSRFLSDTGHGSILDISSSCMMFYVLGAGRSNGKGRPGFVAPLE